MDYNKRRKLIIYGLVALAVIIVGGAVWAILSLGGQGGESEEPEVTVTIDPDTGDEIVDVPGKTPEFEASNEAIVLGGSQLIDNTSITFTQYDLIVDTVQDYAREHVGDISTIKFLPETIEQLAETAAGVPYQYGVQVKTVDPEAILDVTISLVGLDRIRLNIANTSAPDQDVFDSGLVPADEGAHQEDNFDEGLPE